jgi:hypothetical protein
MLHCCKCTIIARYSECYAGHIYGAGESSGRGTGEVTKRRTQDEFGVFPIL